MSEIKANYHTHTTYCDGESSPREIVDEAARLGMAELGFSGHSYTSFDESYCMFLCYIDPDPVGFLRHTIMGIVVGNRSEIVSCWCIAVSFIWTFRCSFGRSIGFPVVFEGKLRMFADIRAVFLYYISVMARYIE